MLLLNLPFIDFFQIFLFLFITLCIVLFTKDKHQNFRNYAIGAGASDLTSVTATLVATWASGATLFIILEKTYTEGLYYIFARIGNPLGILLSGYLCMRMHDFMDTLSIAEAMGKLYGKYVRLIVAFLGIIASLGMLTAQFKVMSTTFTILFGLDSTWSTLLAGILVVFYTSYGGIQSVILTDIYQFGIFCIILLLLTVKIYHDTDNASSVFDLFHTHPLFSIKKVFQWSEQFKLSLIVFFWYTIPGVSCPEIFQRLVVSKNVFSAKKAFKNASGIFVIISLILILIGMILLNHKDDLTKKEIFPYIVNNYINSGAKGMLMICVLALCMSSADSMLNVISILFANDLVKVVRKQKEGSVRLAKLAVWFVGSISLGISFWEKDILSLIMSLEGSYIVTVVGIILLTFLGFRTQTIVVYISMVTGSLTAFIWTLIYQNETSILPGLCMNTFTLLSVHYLFGFEGGWLDFSPETPLGLERTEAKLTKRRYKISFWEFSLPKYLSRNTPKNYQFYFFFGLFIAFTDYTMLYFMDYTDKNQYLDILKLATYVITTLVGALLTCSIWLNKLSGKIKQIALSLFWFTSFILTFFTGVLLFILNECNITQLNMLLFSLLISMLYMDFGITFILSTIGAVLAYYFFYLYAQVSPFSLYAIRLDVFSFTYIFIILLIYAKDLWFQKSRFQILSDHHAELIRKFKKFIGRHYEEEGKKKDLMKFYNQLKAFRFNSVVEPDQLETVSHKFQEFQKGLFTTHQTKETDQKAFQNKLELLDVESLIVKVRTKLEAEDIVFTVYYHTVAKQLVCYPLQIIQLLVDSLAFVKKVSTQEQTIYLSIKDTYLKSKHSEMVKVPSISFYITNDPEIPQLKASYQLQVHELKIFIENDDYTLPLISNQAIIQNHQGYYDIKNGEKNMSIHYILPLQK